MLASLARQDDRPELKRELFLLKLQVINGLVQSVEACSCVVSVMLEVGVTDT